MLAARWLQRRCQAEVDDFDLAEVVRQDQVPRFQVPVQVSLAMDMVYSDDELLQVPSGCLQTEGSVTHKVVKQLSAVERFQDLAVVDYFADASGHVRDHGLAGHVEQPDDVGVTAQVAQNLEIIFVNCNSIGQGLFAHAFESNASATIVHC